VAQTDFRQKDRGHDDRSQEGSTAEYVNTAVVGQARKEERPDRDELAEGFFDEALQVGMRTQAPRLLPLYSLLSEDLALASEL
jgi:hypothetical protein